MESLKVITIEKQLQFYKNNLISSLCEFQNIFFHILVNFKLIVFHVYVSVETHVYLNSEVFLNKINTDFHNSKNITPLET